jgi:hypothetical protein
MNECGYKQPVRNVAWAAGEGNAAVMYKSEIRLPHAVVILVGNMLRHVVSCF